MDLKARRKFVSSMMAMGGGMMMGGMPMFGQQTTVPAGGPPYLPLGGVQVGPDGVNGNPPPGPIGAGAPAGAGGARQRGAGGPGGGRPQRAPRPKPAGLAWISGTGIESWPGPGPNSWDLKDHTKITMDNVKKSIERMGGTMSDFLYFQVFFCLHLDDGSPTPTGSAAAAAYLKGYNDIGSVYGSYWADAKFGAPPRSCFALSWIPGNSLIEVIGAASIGMSQNG